MILKPFRIEDLHKICGNLSIYKEIDVVSVFEMKNNMGDVVGVCTWIDEKRRDSDKLRHDQKCKNMKRSQDMQLIQKLRDDQKRMKKVFEVMSGSYM
ncbi:hypothetical protein Tco_0199257 [Tanacetum coccineum]